MTARFNDVDDDDGRGTSQPSCRGEAALAHRPMHRSSSRPISMLPRCKYVHIVNRHGRERKRTAERRVSPFSCVAARYVALRWRTREKSCARGKYIPLSAAARPRLPRTSIGSAVLIPSVRACVRAPRCGLRILRLILALPPAGGQLLENQNRQFLILNSWRRKKKRH